MEKEGATESHTVGWVKTKKYKLDSLALARCMSASGRRLSDSGHWVHLVPLPADVTYGTRAPGATSGHAVATVATSAGIDMMGIISPFSPTLPHQVTPNQLNGMLY